MKDKNEIVSSAKKTLEIEAESVRNLAAFVDDKFADVVIEIAESAGRVVITGIGKSANIGHKIVATLNSTGTPAVFMHAADALHGDLGNVQKDDIVICISNSGNTPEIKSLIPLLKSMGNTLIGMVGKIDSVLAQQANHIINTTVEQEACPYNLAPTSSTTAQLAMGDALAVSLMEYRGFSDDDFARVHPGGALGKKLYIKLKDLLQQTDVPMVSADANIREVIVSISSGRLGASAVVDENQKPVGVITDGDLRRMLQRDENVDGLKAGEIMNGSPKSLDADTLAVKAFSMMEENKITQILVTEQEQLVGIVHLHDILKEGIF